MLPNIVMPLVLFRKDTWTDKQTMMATPLGGKGYSVRPRRLGTDSERITPHTLLIPPSHTPHTPLIPPSHTPHTPLTHLSYPPHTPHTPLTNPSYTPHIPIIPSSYHPHIPRRRSGSLGVLHGAQHGAEVGVVVPLAVAPQAQFESNV